jgi:mRNA-degrading endonuclease toxin of MazEF toxin-antitoxin module
VVQQDVQNETSSSTVVAYLTSKGESEEVLPHTIFVPKPLSGLPQESFVDCGKIITCKWPRDVVACLVKNNRPRLVHHEVLTEVNKGLRKILDLDPKDELDDTRVDLRKSPNAKMKAIQGKRVLITPPDPGDVLLNDFSYHKKTMGELEADTGIDLEKLIPILAEHRSPT